MNREIFIRDTHRGLRYVDGKLERVLEAGRYEIPPSQTWWGARLPRVEIVFVDVRERELTIKGQEILTADKVAIRVSILVQFRVADPRAALHEVENYEDRIYSDVQLAARRALASMSLEEILTNRNRLSEEILRDVQAGAAGYGVSILRADVKDLIFPGNLQEVMNRVLTAERLAQAQLVEARTKAQTQEIESRAKLESERLQSQARLESARLSAQNEAEILEVQTRAQLAAQSAQAQGARAFEEHPALLRLQELETLRELAGNANAKIYIGFDKHVEMAPLSSGE